MQFYFNDLRDLRVPNDLTATLSRRSDKNREIKQLFCVDVQKKVPDARFIAQKIIFLWIECKKRKFVN